MKNYKVLENSIKNSISLGPCIVFYIKPVKSGSACSSDMTTDICREAVKFVIGNVVTFLVGRDICRGSNKFS